MDGACALDLFLAPDLDTDVVLRVLDGGGCGFAVIRSHGDDGSHDGPPGPGRPRRSGRRSRAVYDRRGFGDDSVMLHGSARTCGTTGASAAAAEARIGRSSASARRSASSRR